MNVELLDSEGEKPLANVWTRTRNNPSLMRRYYAADRLGPRGKETLEFSPGSFTKIDTKQRPVSLHNGNKSWIGVPGGEFYVLFEHELKRTVQQTVADTVKNGVRVQQLVTIASVDTPNGNERVIFLGWKEGHKVEIIEDQKVPMIQKNERTYQDEAHATDKRRMAREPPSQRSRERSHARDDSRRAADKRRRESPSWRSRERSYRAERRSPDRYERRSSQPSRGSRSSDRRRR